MRNTTSSFCFRRYTVIREIRQMLGESTDGLEFSELAWSGEKFRNRFIGRIVERLTSIVIRLGALPRDHWERFDRWVSLSFPPEDKSCFSS